MKPSVSLFSLFIKRIFLLLVLYQINRLGFYYYNLSFFPEINYSIFKGGLIFDSSIIAYINSIFIILHFLPGKVENNKNYQNFLFYSFFIVNGIFISLNFIDYEYFRFVGRRSSFSMITAEGMSNEIGGLIQSYLLDYWQIPLFVIINLFLFWSLLKRIKYKPIKPLSLNKSIFSIFLGLLIFFIIGRGIEKKPLGVVNSSQYGNIENSVLVLNTPFTVLHSLGKSNDLKPIHYFLMK